MRACAIATLALAGCLLQTPSPAPVHPSPSAPPPARDTRAIEVTWVGHSTALIRIDDRWFLTDPIFSERMAGIVPRNIEAAMSPRELPPLDAILISHAHFDHLDNPSLRRILPTPIVVPSGARKFIASDVAASADVAALATWQTWTRDGVTITAVPASHGDGRYLIDRWNRHSHTGYVIEYHGLTVYFAGDTGYVPAQTDAIRARFAIDVALIPVGPAGRAGWIERWRSDVHANPDAAMQLFARSHAQWMVPIHFNTFFEPAGYERPFIERAIAASDAGSRVRMLSIGESTEFLY